jgi:nucleotide-binding universal stress UspA family protein
MYRKIVLAYDGSEAGQKALLDSQDIGQWSSSEIVLVAVMPLPVTSIAAEMWAYSPEADEAERRRIEAVLATGVQRLQAAGLSARGVMLTGVAVDEIVKLAADEHADLIVVGHKHRGSWAERWWRGSVSQALIEEASCSVLVVITP